MLCRSAASSSFGPCLYPFSTSRDMPRRSQSTFTVFLSDFECRIIARTTLGGAVANYLGRFNTLAGVSVICGILNFCWLAIHTLGGMIVFSAFWGFFSRTIIGLFPATMAMTASKPNEINFYLGMGLGTHLGTAFIFNISYIRFPA